jgi:hypothetical protein
MSSTKALLDKGDPEKQYKLVEELAVGSYGRVYRVLHLNPSSRSSLVFFQSATDNFFFPSQMGSWNAQ